MKMLAYLTDLTRHSIGTPILNYDDMQLRWYSLCLLYLPATDFPSFLIDKNKIILCCIAIAFSPNIEWSNDHSSLL